MRGLKKPPSPPAEATEPGPGLLSDLGGWMLAHPLSIPVLLAAAWIGALYGWSRLRNHQAQRGRAVAPLGMIVRNVVRFVRKDDTIPVFTKPAALAAKTQWLTGRRLYLLLLAAAAVGFVTGVGGFRVLLVFLAVLYWRAGKVFKIRRGIVNQMFAVAAAECRYPKGSELAPWSYINVQEWKDQIRPGTTIVSYPAAYQSEEVKTREKFERQFNGTISDENTWNYTWESSKNRVICQPTDFLPTMAPYPGPGPKWNEFVLGDAGDDQAKWDVSTFPHALICGPTGSGKSVLQRMILFHALAHSDTWKILGVDPKMVEMGWLKKYPSVLKIALTLEEGVEVVQSARDEMMRRYDEMSELNINHFQNLPEPPPALLVMVDETFNFLALEGIKSDEGKERDELHSRGSVLLGEIARLGRAAGVHLALATQRPDATVIKGEMKNNLDCRIAAGRLDTTPSLMVMDSEAATRLPKIKGRGMIRLGGDMLTFQGYFAEQNWYDNWLAAQEAAQAGEGEPGAGLAGVPVPAKRARRFSLRSLADRAAAKGAARAAALDAGTEPGPAPSEAAMTPEHEALVDDYPVFDAPVPDLDEPARVPADPGLDEIPQATPQATGGTGADSPTAQVGGPAMPPPSLDPAPALDVTTPPAPAPASAPRPAVPVAEAPPVPSYVPVVTAAPGTPSTAVTAPGTPAAPPGAAKRGTLPNYFAAESAAPATTTAATVTGPPASGRAVPPPPPPSTPLVTPVAPVAPVAPPTEDPEETRAPGLPPRPMGLPVQRPTLPPKAG